MQRITINRSIIIFLTMFLLFPVRQTLANAAYADLQIPGKSRNIGTGEISMEGGFSVHDGTGHYRAGANNHTMNLTTGAITNPGAPSSMLGNGYGGPFGMYDSFTNIFYAATYYGAGDSYISLFGFSGNCYPDSWLIMWNSTAGDGENDDIFAVKLDITFVWFGLLDIKGDFAKSNPRCRFYPFGGSTAETSAVPVPAAVWLLGSGLIGMIGLRRKFIS